MTADLISDSMSRQCRRYGSLKWPFSEKKSYAGSAAFVVGAFTVCAILLSLLSATGSLAGFDVASKLPHLLLISVICALVELIPIGQHSSLPLFSPSSFSRLLLFE